MKEDINHIKFNLIAEYWPGILLFVFVVFFLIRLYRWLIVPIQFTFSRVIDYLIQIPVFFIVLALIVLSIRGGIQTKPISLVTAGKYAPAESAPIVLNSGFTLIRTIGKEGLSKKHFFQNAEEMKKYFNPEKKYTGKNFSHKNIVLIILESFSNEHLNSLNTPKILSEGQNFAPFLDSLIHEGFFCARAFANGKRSVEGIPAIISSIPTLMNTPFVLSPYINNKFNSLPQLLKNYGYRSMFFHGGQNGTMNFDSFASAAGFDNYYGKDEYPDKADFDGKWGIWDEPYLHYVAGMLNNEKQPFFATIFTLSSHHPYRVPEKYNSVLPDGPLPIHKAIAYTDLSLRKFFNSISDKPWYLNTIFVITSDHASEPYLDYYKSSAGLFSVPLLFYEPGSNLSGRNDKVCQQTDIMPSILDYLGFTGTFSAFGNSIFDKDYNGYNLSYQSGTYQLISDSIMITFENDTPVRIVNYLKNSGKNEIDISKNDSMLFYYSNVYRSFIQQYNNSLIDNSLLNFPQK